MEKISFNFLKFLQIVENLNPRNSGILFSILFHLTILLFAVGLPNFFGPKDIYVPNIIPIEILNVSENTNFEKSDSKNNTVKKDVSTKQKNSRNRFRPTRKCNYWSWIIEYGQLIRDNLWSS